MSLAAVRGFFRTRLNGLGYKEHFDGFDDANRPQANFDKLYRIESGPVTGSPANMTTHEFDFDVTLLVSLKGKNNNVELVDRAFAVAEEILADILQTSVRSSSAIKDVVPNSINVSPYSVDNDDDLILSLNFTGTVICQF